MRYTKQAVIVSDSTVAETSFKLVLVVKFREAGIFTLLVIAKKGANTNELAAIWDKAPDCDIGLTIFSCNVCSGDYNMTDDIGNYFEGMVLAARAKVVDQGLFIVNDGRSFSRLKPSVYPALVKQAQDIIKTEGGDLHDCEDCL